MDHTLSKKAYTKACACLPGGVDSPVRAFSSVGCTPIFADHAQGSHLFDIDGNSYIDYIGSWGPMILGHAPAFLQETLLSAARKGTGFGLPTVLETELAELIKEAYPSVDMVRMVNSGTEAVMSAIRVARAYTGKDKIIKFEGNYHGHSDGLLVSSGSGALTYQMPTSPGVPQDIIRHTLVCTYNDIESVKEAMNSHKGEIAAVILEPIAGNMGFVQAEPIFLKELRRLCTEEDVLLIFDEVISGFRVAYEGAQGLYRVKPDMTCFGKIIGGGLPVGAYGGKKEIMQMVSPSGPVYQAGTLSGNPLAMHMGIAMLTYIKEHPDIYAHLEAFGAKLQEGMQAILDQYCLPYRLQRCGSLMTLFFTDRKVRSYKDVQTCDLQLYQTYFQGMLKRGILLAPSQFEVIFISAAHDLRDLQDTLIAFEQTMKELL